SLLVVSPETGSEALVARLRLDALGLALIWSTRSRAASSKALRSASWKSLGRKTKVVKIHQPIRPTKSTPIVPEIHFQPGIAFMMPEIDIKQSTSVVGTTEVDCSGKQSRGLVAALRAKSEGFLELALKCTALVEVGHADL